MRSASTIGTLDLWGARESHRERGHKRTLIASPREGTFR